MGFIINQQLCIACGQCEADCPAHAITHAADAAANKDQYQVNQARCIECSHCACICPMAAVEDGAGPFSDWQAPCLNPEDVDVFLAGKRSVRQFHDREVPRQVIEKMLEVGEHTSTASNIQDWHATFVASREKKDFLILKTKKMQTLICNALKHKPIRLLAKLVPAGKAYLSNPNFFEKLKVLEEEAASDKDFVFF